MNILVSLFIIIIYLVSPSFINGQQISLNDVSKICNHLDIESLLKYVNFSELDTTLTNALKNNLYPMNDTVILDSVVKNTNPCPFRERVLQKMSKNETVNVIIIGGSNTEGMGISDALRNEKRWSKVFDNYMNSGWYSGNFNVINIGKGGWGISMWITRLDELISYNPDIIITDFTVNDGDDMHNHSLKALYDVFLKLMESLEPKPALLMDFTLRIDRKNNEHVPNDKYGYYVKFENTNEFFGSYKLWKISDFGREIVEKYSVPYTSYRDVFYRDFFDPPKNILNFWSDGVHPGIETHKYMGDHMFNSFAYLIKDSLFSNKCYSKKLRDVYKYCNYSGYIDPKYYDKSVGPVCYPKNIINKMDSTKSSSSRDTFIMGPRFNEETSNWKFYADSKSKFGWIYDVKFPKVNDYINSRLKFKDNITYKDIPQKDILSFSINTNNLLQITYLVSYPEYFGGFLAWFDEDINNLTFQDVHWPSKTSIPLNLHFFFNNKVIINNKLIKRSVDYYHIEPGNHVLNLFPIIPRNSDFDRLKVKILSVLSC